MDTIKQASNFVSDKIQGTTDSVSKEANKDIAKDSNLSAGTRVQAGVDAVKDKISQHGHEASAEANKQAATH